MGVAGRDREEVLFSIFQCMSVSYFCFYKNLHLQINVLLIILNSFTEKKFCIAVA